MVLLDAVLAAIGEDHMLLAIPGAKFLAPVSPGERIELLLEFPVSQEVRVEDRAQAAMAQRVSFHGLRGTTRVFEGVLLMAKRESVK